MKTVLRIIFGMFRIRRGGVYAFFLKERNQYGLIQALGKGKICGWNVRVFYDLVNDLDDKTIETAVQSDRFYYIHNFHSADLVGASARLGRFSIPYFVITPKYMREAERQPGGKVVWHVMEDLRVIKTYEQFDESLKVLSPAVSWGIHSIKVCWLDGFTLDNWHELMDKWYLDYLYK